MEVNKSIISLTEFEDGQSGTIVSLNGGRNLTKRLADLGIRPGTMITVLRLIIIFRAGTG